MNVKKFSLEDAVEYVLGSLDPKKKQLFEIELRHNKELQELLKLVEANKEYYEEIEQHKFSDIYINALYEKVKNILSEDADYSPGSVFKIETSDLPLKYKRFLDDLFFVIISKTASSITKGNFRVVPLSRLTSFVQSYDIVFTDSLISSKELNVVAHMHLVTNVMKNRLKHYLGKLQTENYKAIAHADLRNYSFVDNETILTGSKYRERFYVDEYFIEEFEVWNSIIQEALHSLRHEVFENLEYESTFDEKEMIKPRPAAERSEIYLADEEDFQRLKFLALSKMHGVPREETSRYYEMDDEGFLIVRDTKGFFRKKYPNLKFKDFKKKIIEVDYERLSKMIYHKVDEFINKQSILKSFENYSLMKLDYDELFIIEEEELRFAARQYALTKLPDVDISLFADDKMSILFSFYGEKLILEVNFLKKERVRFIENFHFIFLSNSSGFWLPQVPVKNNQAQIPLNFDSDDINNLQDGYIIGFIYNGKSVKLYLRLILH